MCRFSRFRLDDSHDMYTRYTRHSREDDVRRGWSYRPGIIFDVLCLIFLVFVLSHTDGLFVIFTLDC